MFHYFLCFAYVEHSSSNEILTSLWTMQSVISFYYMTRNDIFLDKQETILIHEIFFSEQELLSDISDFIQQRMSFEKLETILYNTFNNGL